MSCKVAPTQANKKTCKQFPSEFNGSWLTLPLRARSDTKKTPLKKRLKSHDCELHDDSSTDRLFPMMSDIGLPLTEKSTDSRRPVVEDMEVSFSKRSRLSYPGFQHSEDITCFLCEATLRLTGSPTFVTSSCLCGCQLHKTHSILFFYSAHSHLCKNTEEQTCQTFISQLRSTVN